MTSLEHAVRYVEATFNAFETLPVRPQGSTRQPATLERCAAELVEKLNVTMVSELINRLREAGYLPTGNEVLALESSPRQALTQMLARYIILRDPALAKRNARRQR